MRYTKIKNTDLQPALICLGTASIGVKNTEEESYRLLDYYLDQGGNFIDTARVYSNWVPGEKNRSERILGDWIKARGNREEIIVATKGGHSRLAEMDKSRLSRDEVTEDLEGSLKTLQTDYIDLYYLHRDDPDIPVSEIIDMLQGFVEEGKIKYYGCSNWSTARIRKALAYAKKKNCQGFAANQMLWNMGSYNMKSPGDPTLVRFDADMYQLHKDTGVAAVPYSSQANGFFNKLNSEKKEDIEKVKNSNYNTEENMKLFYQLKGYCRDLGMNLTEIVLSYLLSQDIYTIPIVGCRTPEQLKDSLNAVDQKLPGELLQQLEKLAGSGIIH